MAVFDEVMFFPSLLKKAGVYYAWMKVAGGPQVRHNIRFGSGFGFSAINESVQFQLQFRARVDPITVLEPIPDIQIHVIPIPVLFVAITIPFPNPAKNGVINLKHLYVIDQSSTLSDL